MDGTANAVDQLGIDLWGGVTYREMGDVTMTRLVTHPPMTIFIVNTPHTHKQPLNQHTQGQKADRR